MTAAPGPGTALRRRPGRADRRDETQAGLRARAPPRLPAPGRTEPIRAARPGPPLTCAAAERWRCSVPRRRRRRHVRAAQGGGEGTGGNGRERRGSSGGSGRRDRRPGPAWPRAAPAAGTAPPSAGASAAERPRVGQARHCWARFGLSRLGTASFRLGQGSAPLGLGQPRLGSARLRSARPSQTPPAWLRPAGRPGHALLTQGQRDRAPSPPALWGRPAVSSGTGQTRTHHLGQPSQCRVRAGG